jgi:hypothetical protein
VNWSDARGTTRRALDGVEVIPWIPGRRTLLDYGKQSAAPRPRPRFDIFVGLQPDQVFQNLRVAIHTTPSVRAMTLDGRRFEIIREDRSWRLWAPQLDVKILPFEDGTKVMGRFGPHPHVWMAYLALYMVTLFLAIAFATYGAVQWTLDEDPWSLYLTPIAVVCAGLIYGASYVGQGLATAQMYELREFLEESIESLESIESVEDDEDDEP